MQLKNPSPDFRFLQEHKLLRMWLTHPPTKGRALKFLYIRVLVSPGFQLNHFCLNPSRG